jgi:hypothetical protein
MSPYRWSGTTAWVLFMDSDGYINTFGYTHNTYGVRQYPFKLIY